MTFPHEEFSASPEENNEAHEVSPWWRPVAVPFASALVAFAIGALVAMLIVSERADVEEAPVVDPSAQVDPTSPIGDSDVGVIDTDASIEELVVDWFSKVEYLPKCRPSLQALVDASAGEEWGQYLSCKTFNVGQVSDGDYNGWIVSYQVLEQDGDLGGPAQRMIAMLVSPEDPKREVVLTSYFETSSMMSPMARSLSGIDFVGSYQEAWNAMMSTARVGDESLRLADLDQQSKNQTLIAGGPLDGQRVSLKWLGTGGFDSDAMYQLPIHLQAYAIGSLADGRLVAPSEELRLRGALVARRADGRTDYYDVLAPIFHPDEQYGYLSAQGTVDVKWNDGATLGLYTKSARTGCGISAPADIISPSAVGELRVTGKTFSGDVISEYVSLPESMTWMHELWAHQQPEGADMSVEAFMAIHPFFFWEDELGRLLRFTRSDAIPMAECGKPVIYLYPETTMDVSVKLAPEGGFSKTEPAYGEGWNVTASPDGTLVNKADGKTYPYLFWEGTGGLYQSPLNFDVVARDDVESYMKTTLAELGLNEKETADFLEFWLPLMQESSYYKIGWHGKTMMDALAPMSLSVRPDSVIRVLMDFEELNAPTASHPQTFRTPKREGFTVVEWGGVLR